MQKDRKMDEVGKNKLKCTQNKKLMEVEDIVYNILSKLPVKSLLICKSVCKCWRKLISTPSFIRIQLYEFKENPSYIAQSWSKSLRETYLLKFDENIFEKIPYPGRKRSYNMICYFNGLICYTNYFNRNRPGTSLEVHICNPATKKVLLLPKVPLHNHWARIGVAVGPKINDYKVYGFFGNASKSQEKLMECKVYSSMTKSWKCIRHVSEIPMSFQHICINETVYWFMRSERSGFIPGSILGIDREENFIRISLPREAIINKYLFFVDLEGCLSLVSTSGAWFRGFDIWVLKNGNQLIWVKKFIDIEPILGFGNVFPVSVRKNEILFARKMHRHLVYGVDKKTWRINWMDTSRRSFLTAFAFTESLLPCGGLN